MRGKTEKLEDDGILLRDDDRRHVTHVKYELWITPTCDRAGDQWLEAQLEIDGTIQPAPGVELQGAVTYVLVLADNRELPIQVNPVYQTYKIIPVGSLRTGTSG